MRSEDLARLKRILLQQKSDLLNKTNRFKDNSPSIKTLQGGDEADLASNEIHMNLDLRLHERERVLVHKIEAALGRMESGSYGYCNECEEQMDVKRLEARPIATLCIACKEEQESRQRIYAYV